MFFKRPCYFLFFCLAIFNARASSGPQANFTANKFAGCPPLNVTFTDASTGGVTSWFWNFGNGNTSVLQNPSATFLTSGNYTVTLVVTGNSGSDSVVKTIEVLVLPTVNFSAENPVACLTDTVRFISDVSPGNSPIVSYAWGFGDGKAGSGENASYQYSQPGVYSITLVVQDSNGCNAYKTVPDYIAINAMPTAGFTASPASSCDSVQTVSFTNTSTGTGLSYQWSLDNGVSSTLQNPTYTYTQESYIVILLVTDSNGCKSSASQKVGATELVAGFKTGKTLACTGQKVAFQNASNFNGTSWFWDFGNGLTSTTNNPTIEYEDTGTYTIKFVIQEGSCSDSMTRVKYVHVINGFSSNSTTFTADTTISCGQSLTVNFDNTTAGTDTSDIYLWTFGNGDSSSGQNPTETYSTPGDYNVSLTVTDSNGCVISSIATNFIETGTPAPSFTVPPIGCPGVPVSFYNHSSSAGSYLWKFGDGDSSAITSPSHAYALPGKYSVTLTAYGAGGCDSSFTLNNAVTIGVLPASFVIKDTFSPCPPFVTIFKNTTVEGAQSFLWNFGDGNTDTTANPTHIYYYPGVFTVTLTAYRSKVCDDSMVRPNLITVQGPKGNFNITPNTGCLPLQVSVSSAMDSMVKTFSCDMGDGYVTTDTASFNHTYYQARVYNPQFILTDYAGCSVSYPLNPITVHSNPTVQLHDTTVCAGTPVLYSFSPDTNSYQWVPASYISCDTCGSVIINAPDTMRYWLVATNSRGCHAVDSMHLNVVPLPVLNDSATVNLCKNDSMVVSAGKPQYRYLWSPGIFLSDSTIASPVCTPLSTVQYIVSAFNTLGCPAQTSFSFNVHGKVEVTLPPDTSVCLHQSLQLNPVLIYGSALGVQYSWSPAGLLSNPGIANPEISPDKDEQLTLIATSGHCSADTLNIDVKVIPLPDIEVSPPVITTPGAAVGLYAESHQDLNYKWIATDSLSCPDCRRTDIFPNASQLVYVRGTNSFGCEVTDSVAITVEGCDPKTVFLPNTFTPNGDGIDDKFYIRTTSLSSLRFFRIFNSSGEQVFETDNLNEGWDGTFRGQAAPISVYVYELQGTCQNGYSVFKSGNVTAIR